MPIDEKEYRKKWEDGLEKQLESMDSSLMRLNGRLGDIEGQSKQQYIELHEDAHDAKAAAIAIGKKLDGLAKSLNELGEDVRKEIKNTALPKEVRNGLVERWNLLDDLTTFYGFARKAIWLGLIGIAGALVVFAIKSGLYG